jgi:hypothetical protein
MLKIQILHFYLLLILMVFLGHQEEIIHKMIILIIMLHGVGELMEEQQLVIQKVLQLAQYKQILKEVLV